MIFTFAKTLNFAKFFWEIKILYCLHFDPHIFQVKHKVSQDIIVQWIEDNMQTVSFHTFSCSLYVFKHQYCQEDVNVYDTSMLWSEKVQIIICFIEQHICYFALDLQIETFCLYKTMGRINIFLQPFFPSSRVDVELTKTVFKVVLLHDILRLQIDSFSGDLFSSRSSAECVSFFIFNTIKNQLPLIWVKYPLNEVFQFANSTFAVGITQVLNEKTRR